MEHGDAEPCCKLYYWVIRSSRSSNRQNDVANGVHDDSHELGFFDCPVASSGRRECLHIEGMESRGRLRMA